MHLQKLAAGDRTIYRITPYKGPTAATPPPLTVKPQPTPKPKSVPVPSGMAKPTLRPVPKPTAHGTPTLKPVQSQPGAQSWRRQPHPKKQKHFKPA